MRGTRCSPCCQLMLLNMSKKKMPPDMQRKVLKYIEALSARTHEKRHGTMKFAWAGACADMNNEYTFCTTPKKKFSTGGNEVYLLDTNIFLEVLLNR